MQTHEEASSDNFYAALQRLRAEEDRLTDLSHAFARVGQGDMANELYLSAKALREIREATYAAFGVELDRGFRQAQEASTNILRTALAVSGSLE